MPRLVSQLSPLLMIYRAFSTLDTDRPRTTVRELEQDSCNGLHFHYRELSKVGVQPLDSKIVTALAQ